ncbi:MAG: DegQ family serine endoprotease [Burkholderiales bacterium]|nr:DegQ family serine endoprotease [Burkholderiales bacterium]
MIRHWLFASIAAAAVCLPAVAAELPDFTELVEAQGPAVVNISTTSSKAAQQAPGQGPGGPEDDPFFDFFRRYGPPGQPREQEARSLGSGFIISPDGYIMTNAHVVEAGDDITVRLTDKREYTAKVIGADKRSDVAVIKIEAANLPKVTIGDANKLKVGEWVLAIGSPFGFDNTVTAGIVSAKGRSLPQENFTPFIQTDVAINPGNSGGPLFNLKGEVVGINSQIYSRTGGFMGLSFAIPIDVAMDIANQLRTAGKVTRGRIGVVIQEVTKELAESFGLSKPQGALVNSVEKGGPAEKAGIEQSDIILKFDGKTVNSSADLPRIVAATRPGSKSTVQVWRKGSNKELTVTVGELQDDKRADRQPKKPAKAGDAVAKLGMTLTELTADQRKELGIASGLLVEDAQGNAAKAGIRRGDILMAINNQDVKTLEQLNQIIGQFEKSRSVALLIRRGESSLYVPLRLNGN